MQLDRTRIAVRERGGVDILDMALHIVRTFFRPWWQATLVGALPFIIINAVLLIGIPEDPEVSFPYRYSWLMIVLVFIEAPFATAIVTAYMGSAVFEEKTNVRQALRDTLKRLPQLLWCQGFIRGVLPAIALVAIARSSDEINWFIEAFLLLVLMLYVMAMRAFRPFINEIVLLERNPIRSKNPTAITAGKRSKYLHDPSGGDLVMRWMGASMIAILLSLAFTETLGAASGIFFGQWKWGWFMLYIGFPLVLWLVAGYMSVVRYLNYLDLRIRHEGWEVELRLRAEAVRMASKLT
ncbi:MAG TPA: hypothetical protein VL096_21090 [Pirellulaceae bacterium]|nr:hypothetical protein [Pirellulaceae bacterium]